MHFVADMYHIVSLQAFDVYVKIIYWFEINIRSLRPGSPISILLVEGAPGVGNDGGVVFGNKGIVGGAVYISSCQNIGIRVF